MKNTAMYIAKNQGIVWNMDLLIQLNVICKLANTKVVSLQPFIFLAIEEPSHIDWGL